MSEFTFSLQAFERTGSPEVQVEGKVDLSDKIFKIEYILSGEVKSIKIPQLKSEKERRDELWTTTCFEFFLGIENSPRYWEFNLSPSGDWNIYRFEDYRQGMEEERKISRLPFKVQSRDNSVSLDLEFNLAAIIGESEAVEIAIATVIQTQAGEISYWALKHCNKEADFHCRESFVRLS